MTNLTSGECERLFILPSQITRFVLCQKERLLVVGREDGVLQVLDVGTASSLWEQPLFDNVRMKMDDHM